MDRYGDPLFRVAVARVGDPSVAEDLVQETFLAAWKGRGSFDGRSTLGTWLVAILKRKIVDHFAGRADAARPSRTSRPATCRRCSTSAASGGNGSATSWSRWKPASSAPSSGGCWRRVPPELPATLGQAFSLRELKAVSPRRRVREARHHAQEPVGTFAPRAAAAAPLPGSQLVGRQRGRLMRPSDLHKILTLQCEQASLLISESLDRELTLGERTALGLHKLLCHKCRRVTRQLRRLHELFARLPTPCRAGWCRAAASFQKRASCRSPKPCARLRRNAISISAKSRGGWLGVGAKRSPQRRYTGIGGPGGSPSARPSHQLLNHESANH